MKTIAVWFSCGVASAVASKKTIEKYGETHNILIVNNPVKNEHPDNLRFMADVENWIGQKIIRATNKNYPNADIVGKRIFLDELLETDRGGKIKSYECGIFCDTE